MTSTITKFALPVVLLSALALSGCGGDDENDAASDASSSQSSASPSESPSEDNPLPGNTDDTSDDASSAGGGALPGAADLTPPGTSLKLGESAVLPAEYAGKKAAVEFTVTKIRKGTEAELTKAGVKNAKGYTPFYIDYTMKLVALDGDTFGGYDGGSDIDGFIGDQRAGSLITFGDFAPCEDGGFENDAVVGATATGCNAALAPGGTAVDTVEFSGGGKAAGYDSFDGKPVTWK